MYRFDSGSIYPAPERGQIHVDGNEVHRPDRVSVPAVRKLGFPISGYRKYAFDEPDVVECIERLDNAGHRITVTWRTIKQYGQNWDITKEGNHYPENWDEIRKVVYRRDDHTCRRCGETDTVLHAHHRVPISEGGDHKLRNLETLCKNCHENIHGFSFD